MPILSPTWSRPIRRNPVTNRSIVKETFMDIVIADDEPHSGRIVSTRFGPAGHSVSRRLHPRPTSRLRTSGVIESGGSW